VQNTYLVVENAHFARISNVRLALFRLKDGIRCMNGDNQSDNHFSVSGAVKSIGDRRAQIVSGRMGLTPG
jgi:hypothetical protein